MVHAKPFIASSMYKRVNGSVECPQWLIKLYVYHE